MLKRICFLFLYLTVLSASLKASDSIVCIRAIPAEREAAAAKAREAGLELIVKALFALQQGNDFIALDLFTKAILSYDPEVMFEFLLSFDFGRQDLAMVNIKAQIFTNEVVHAFQHVASSENPLALNNWALLLYLGLGVAPNQPEAIRLFKVAALKGSLPASLNLERIFPLSKAKESTLPKEETLSDEEQLAKLPREYHFLYRLGIGVSESLIAAYNRMIEREAGRVGSSENAFEPAEEPVPHLKGASKGSTLTRCFDLGKPVHTLSRFL